MKFDVHCEPWVTVCTPGWMAAVLAGAHVGAACDDGASRPPIATAATATAPMRVRRPGVRRAGTSDTEPPGTGDIQVQRRTRRGVMGLTSPDGTGIPFLAARKLGQEGEQILPGEDARRLAVL